MKTEVSVEDGIGLMDIYDFLADGWKIILSIVFIGIGIGVVTSLALPDQFEARGLIQGAMFGVANKTNSSDVEPIAVLSEKMQSPGYYVSKTLDACVSEGEAVNVEDIAKALNANVARHSKFVSVVFRAESSDKAVRCLEQVLVVVVENQKDLVEANLNYAVSGLDDAKKQADVLRKAIIELESVGAAPLKLEHVESSAALLIAFTTLHLKRQALLIAEEQIYSRELMLLPQNTHEAKFAMPIYASEQRVSPRRSLIVMISAMVSLFFGVLMLLSMRVFASVKKHHGERLKSSSIRS